MADNHFRREKVGGQKQMKPLTIQWNILTNFLFDVIKSRIKKYPLNFYEGAKEKKNNRHGLFNGREKEREILCPCEKYERNVAEKK